MKSIAQFYTWYWIIYFPTCIAFNDLSGFGYVDEVMTIILIGYTIMQYNNPSTNRFPWKEYKVFLGILAFYVIYSLIMAVGYPGGVWLDFVQYIRPFSIIYCTWILNPRFTNRQQKWMLGTMILTSVVWLFYHPAVAEGMEKNAVIGQLAICSAMAYFLFSKDTKRNLWIALLIAGIGLLGAKFKFIGEFVTFVLLLFYVKERFNFKSGKTILYLALLTVAVLFFTWTQFDIYYVSGWDNSNMARPMTYKTSLKILKDYFPLGSGMGTFASFGSWQYYSPLYYKYELNHIWGLNEGGGFICDAFYPALAQFGVIGVILFGIFWKRRLIGFNQISDLKYYKVAMMAFFCLAIEQTADSSFLSGKGMGYCMLIGLCLNANRNMGIEEKVLYKKPKRRGVPPLKNEEVSN